MHIQLRRYPALLAFLGVFFPFVCLFFLRVLLIFHILAVLNDEGQSVRRRLVFQDC